MTRRPELSFVAVQIVVWAALVAVLVGSIRNVAWAFDSVAGGSSGGWAWVQAAGVDLGLLAMAMGMQLRRKQDRPVAWLRIGAVAFSIVSAGANAMHGYAHQIVAPGVPPWMLLARPWSLGAILPALAFVLIEVAGHNVDKLLAAKPATDTPQFVEAQQSDFGTAAHTGTGNGDGNGVGKDAAYREWLHNRHLQLAGIAAIGGCSLSTASRWRKAWQETLALVEADIIAVQARRE